MKLIVNAITAVYGLLWGDPITIPQEGLTVSDVPLDGSTRASYRFTDLYGRSCWSAVIP